MNRSILIADPSPVMRSWLRVALSSVASRIVEADAGMELLEQFAYEGPFDLIVANRALPGMTGEQVLAALRTAGDQTPMLAIAPFCRDKVRATFARLGGVAILEDSLDAAALLREVRALLADYPLAA